MALALLLAVPADAADMRGKVVCGVPADEAVGIAWATQPDSWRWLGVTTRTMHDAHPSMIEAVEWHAPEASPVCAVEIMDNFRRFPARFFRYHRPLLPSEADARSMIIGTRDASPGEATGPAGMEFVWIPPGSFQMGSTSSVGRSDEQPVMQVRISKGFWLGKYEVTQSEWETVMGSNPSKFSSCRRCPVEQVSWEDVQQFILRLNLPEGRGVYRLPTEAEWEYSARAGTTGDRYGDLDAIAWYADNSGDRTHPVGGKAPNAWGLHDMVGNVWEWVHDWYGAYPGGSMTDPRGPGSGSFRVLRGGGWSFGARYVRAPYRLHLDPGNRLDGLGFRLLRKGTPANR